MSVTATVENGTIKLPSDIAWPSGSQQVRIELVEQPGPSLADSLRAFIGIVDDLPADYADERLKFADGVPPTMTSSMHHDLERGNPLEVEWLSGGVVTLGRERGVSTPLNRTVWDVLALYAQGRV